MAALSIVDVLLLLGCNLLPLCHFLALVGLRWRHLLSCHLTCDHLLGTTASHACALLGASWGLDIWHTFLRVGSVTCCAVLLWHGVTDFLWPVWLMWLFPGAVLMQFSHLLCHFGLPFFGVHILPVLRWWSILHISRLLVVVKSCILGEEGKIGDSIQCHQVLMFAFSVWWCDLGYLWMGKSGSLGCTRFILENVYFASFELHKERLSFFALCAIILAIDRTFLCI